MIVLFIGSFVFLLVISAPIMVALGGSALVYAIASGDIPLTTLIQTTFGGLASFPLLAIPLFILGGNLMKEGGITEDLIAFTRLLLGHIWGGLGHAAIFASAIFSTITGAAVATAAAIGSLMIPAMRDAGYDEDVGAGLVATASCMGPIIPPSIPFIIYGVTADISIGKLFLGGVLPGILLGLSLMAYTYVMAKKRGYPRDARAPLKVVLTSAAKATPALFMPVIIMGGIIGGLFTPTEAAGVVVVYSLLVGFFVYRKLSLKRLPAILLASGLESGMVMLLIALSEPFAWIIAVDQIPQLIIEAISGFTQSPYLILLLINLLLLLIGIPLETAPAIVIVTPVIAPLAVTLGIDPVHIGVVVCLNLVLGLITPPVGAVLFAICGITGISIDRLSSAIWKPFLISLIVLLIVTYIPWLSTFFPRWIG